MIVDATCEPACITPHWDAAHAVCDIEVPTSVVVAPTLDDVVRSAARHGVNADKLRTMVSSGMDAEAFYVELFEGHIQVETFNSDAPEVVRQNLSHLFQS